MTERKFCCYCGAEGHRANQCPRRLSLLPRAGSDLLLAAAVVALIAGVASHV
jgi:hypothetical protein